MNQQESYPQVKEVARHIQQHLGIYMCGAALAVGAYNVISCGAHLDDLEILKTASPAVSEAVITDIEDQASLNAALAAVSGTVLVGAGVGTGINMWRGRRSQSQQD